MDIKKDINRKISVAPMMDCTDRHDRYFLRLMSKNVMLYSEMVATKSAIHGDRKKILSYSPEEKPLALQVGGSDKTELAEVAKIAEDMGYDEININLGCPSKKVQKNMFGACLMKEPDLVAECINSMVNACKIPVTAKTRIGFDDTEEFDYLNNFILKMKDVGCSTFILHARKAILTGMSPKQNLNIPKLNYGMVYKIKEENPDLEIIINGGISKIDEIKNHLALCDGVMIGRSIYQNPYSLVEIENEIFGTKEQPTREEIAEKLLEYLEKEVKLGTKVNHIMRHTVGLYHGQIGSKDWKRYLSDNMMARDSDFQKSKHIMTIVQNNEKANQANS
ncbi:tRNA dihydrouridine(20/20a) synthase DusA [Candidatus Pelagibacter ubique]|nr:tRNA dihydrouridine(20/20a) synthase DusA [Candidatus Pelagibacter bacterium]MDA7447794.1 tRNA dihydrouridine(20/20a) synthase DusA [Candidatus Pelagibacter ubique]MDB2601781.1 tRNA dihydrouridine(20/20a) synthase DusA [Candidatus Pelagibacter bacterium]MDB9757708.1 tRNA dihydrouridine(20/20a) synthase DusA [Candidatus Pelagibacter ubique]